MQFLVGQSRDVEMSRANVFSAAVAIILFFAQLVFGQDRYVLAPKEPAPPELKVTGPGVRVVTVIDAASTEKPIKVEAPSGGFLYRWNIPNGVTAAKERNVLTIIGAPKGNVTISVEWVTYNATITPPIEEKSASITFVIGEATPGPKPPEPKPDAAPIPVDGFRVLVVLEKDDRPTYPAAQVAALTSLDFETYLNRKCAKEDNGWSSWRVWDQHTDTVNAPKYWQDALKRPRKELPWIVISNHPNGGYEGPLPKSLPEIMKLLKTIGGE